MRKVNESAMNEQVKEYIEKYPEEITGLFKKLRQLVFDSTDIEPEEKLWAKLPSYCVGEAFVRLIPFKDHINVEAAAILGHKDEFMGFNLTPKGMLQIFSGQDIPTDVLKRIFAETFG